MSNEQRQPNAQKREGRGPSPKGTSELFAKEGFVALLDVLGFRDMVRGASAGGQMNRYLEIVREAALETEVESLVFSDSIILTTGERTDEESSQFLDIVRTCSRMLGRLLQEEIALRGAIAFGNILKRNVEQPTKSVFIAGRAIVEAYEFERAQDWIGIMLSPSVLKQLPFLEQRCMLRPDDPAQLIQSVPWGGHIQRCGGIPMHGDGNEAKSYDGFAVVPTISALRESLPEEEELMSIIAQLNRLRFLAPSPREQHKYTATTNWLDGIRSRFSGLRGHLPRPI